MVYRVLGIMSGSSLDGLDLAFVEFHETSGKWTYEFRQTACYPYSTDWVDNLKGATSLSAREYQLLHTAYGRYIGEQVNRFVEENNLSFQVQLVSSHGHTTFHIPASRTTVQLGDGASIAAITGLNVVSDLRAMDVALGGQGAPIVPIGEKLLLPQYELLLNLGGIANLSFHRQSAYIAFDICAANRVLNLLAAQLNLPYDDRGAIAATGSLDHSLLDQLNQLGYYAKPYPKSLANEFGTEEVYGLISNRGLAIKDALHTYTEHMAIQIRNSIGQLLVEPGAPVKMLVTGGGAHNDYLLSRIQSCLLEWNVEVVKPDDQLVNYKEALIMALIGTLRWRENNNTLASVTGASRNSIGGAVWIGQEG